MNGSKVVYIGEHTPWPSYICVTRDRGYPESRRYYQRETCEMHRDKYGVWHCSSCEKGADKITGSDGALESWNDSWPPNFCPNCGRKVEG